MTSNFNSLNFNTFLFNFNEFFIWLNHISIAFVFGVYGTVKVLLQGACNGCPSSTYTLKQGIETKLKQIIGDEIKEVIAVN